MNKLVSIHAQAICDQASWYSVVDVKMSVEFNNLATVFVVLLEKMKVPKRGRVRR
jgi:hypothetical protein